MMAVDSERDDERRTVMRIFILTAIIIAVIFLGYEVLENTWLANASKSTINLLHLIRGIGTSLIVAGFITWYLVRERPDQSAFEVFVNTTPRSETEHAQRAKRRVVNWFIRLRWLVAAVYMLGLTVAVTVSRNLLWQQNFTSLIYLFGLLVASNVIFRFLTNYEISSHGQFVAQILVDYLLITVFIHLTGGINSPGLLLYLPHVLMTSMLLPGVGGIGFSVLAVVLFVGLGSIEYLGWLPHHGSVLFGEGTGSVYRNARYLLSVGLLFGGVVLSTYFLTSLVMSSLRNYRDELRAEKQQVKRLVEKLFEAREEERGRVSRELHDQVGQTLSTIKLRLSSGDASIDVDTLSASLDDAIDQVRQLSHGLRPPSLDDCGLACAIEDYSNEIETQYEVNVDFEWIGLEHSENVSTAIDTAVYRVAQEAVMNAVEHGDPEHVSIILQQTSRYLQLLVEDDGTGFDQTRLTKGNSTDGLGIQGMKERIELLNGEFELETDPGSGTRVRVEIPLEEKRVNKP